MIGAHVSASPNHQTLRRTPIETRFTVAAAGLLGYECNLCDAKTEDLKAMREQIALYKQWRPVLQFGDFYRLGGSLAEKNGCGDPLETDLVRWMIVSKDGERAAAFTVQGLTLPNYSHRSLRTRGLLPERMYRLRNVPHAGDIRVMGDLINTQSPVHIKQDSLLHGMIAKVKKLEGEVEDMLVSGALLNSAGVQLAPRYAGTGFAEGTALYQDFDARMYFLDIE